MPARPVGPWAALAIAAVAGLALWPAAATPLVEPAPPAAAAARRESAWRENNLGVALLEQFRFADAVAAFGRALAADPALAAARVNLAIAHFYVPDMQAARQAAEQALAAAPDDPHPHYLLALIARSEGRAEEGLPHLQKVLAADPRDLGANLTLGQVYLQMRRFDDAAASFRVALAAEPYNVSAAYNLGVALNRADKRAEAEEAMVRFQKLRDSPYKTALSSNYLEQGRYAEAVASTGAEPEAVDQSTPAVSFVVKPAAFGAPAAAAGPEGARAALALADLDGDGRLDAIVAGASLRLLKGGASGLLRRDRGVGLRGHEGARGGRRRLRQRRRPRPAAAAVDRRVALPERRLRPVPGRDGLARAGRRARVHAGRRVRGRRPRRRPGRLGRRAPAPEQRQRDVHRDHAAGRPQGRARGAAGDPDRLRQPARRGPGVPGARAARALPQLARRKLWRRRPGARSRRRARPAAVRGKGRLQQGRLRGLPLERAGGRLLCDERRSRGLRRLRGAGVGGRRRGRAVRGLRQRRAAGPARGRHERPASAAQPRPIVGRRQRRRLPRRAAQRLLRGRGARDCRPRPGRRRGR